MAARSPEIPGARFSEKKRPNFFAIHRTIDTSIGSPALPKQAYGLYGIFTGQSSVCKVN